tara:strand:+ start:60 stop:338 length:279 start_codon:yes stop_codon:yes gene_type:complete
LKEIKDLIKSGVSIIDVRSAEEFREDHISTSINIPINEVVNRIDEFKSIEQPFLVCSLSGRRSQQVTEYLQSMNIKCFNANGLKQLKNLMTD